MRATETEWQHWALGLVTLAPQHPAHLGGHVKAQPFRVKVRAPLLHVGAQGLPQCPAQQVGGCVLLHAAKAPGLKHSCDPGAWLGGGGKGAVGEQIAWWGSYFVHVQLHRVPHLQVLGGQHLMQDEAPPDLGPGHREQHILGKAEQDTE